MIQGFNGFEISRGLKWLYQRVRDMGIMLAEKMGKADTFRSDFSSI